MDKIDLKEVEHIAKLAKIEILSSETKQYGQDLQRIVKYIGMLDSIDTREIEPTYQVSHNINVMGEDIVTDSLPREKILKLAANSDQKNIITKGVFNHE